MAKYHTATFTWPSTDVEEVVLTGEFDNWTKSVTLRKTKSGFTGTVDLPWGSKVDYKYVIDGTWKLHKDQPVCLDHPYNNVYVVPPKLDDNCFATDSDSLTYNSTTLNAGSGELDGNFVQGAGIFCGRYSDIDVSVGTAVFKSHKILLERFAVIDTLIQKAGAGTPGCPPLIRISMPGQHDDGASDFENTCRMLYKSAVSFKPVQFDTPHLLSALRVSSKFKNPSLKEFCISCLENFPTSPMERLLLARECNISSWEEQAYDELSTRDKIVSSEEARVIGIDAFAKIAGRREMELRNKVAALQSHVTK